MNGSWNAQNRVFGTEPSQRDSIVVTLVNGKRIDVRSVVHYDDALARANWLARHIGLPIKVLSMTAGEFIAFAGIKADDLAKTPEADAEFRQLVVTTLRDAMLNAPDVTDRSDARKVLMEMGEPAW